MPYTGPIVQSHGGLLGDGNAGEILGQGIAAAIGRYVQDKKDREETENWHGILQKAGNGLDDKPYISADVLDRWDQLNDRTRKQYTDIGKQNYLQDQQARRQIAVYRQSRAGDGGSEATVVDPYKDPSTGQVMPGIGIIRKTGGVVRTGAQDPGEPDQYGRYWNGDRWVQLRKDKVDPQTALATSDRQAEIAELTRKIAEHKAAIDQGDNNIGGVMGIGSTPRTQIIAGLKAKRDALNGSQNTDDTTTSQPQPRPVATNGSGPDLLSQARAAITAGAPREAVIARLKERGVDPTGL